MQIVLISASPRRKKILEEAGLAFHTETVEISEIINENLSLPNAVAQIATDKLNAFLASSKSLEYNNFILITADTLVVLGSQVLGKPTDTTEAKSFLRLLSGKKHKVLTGVCVFDPRTKSRFVSTQETEVEFRILTESEILDYVATGSPMDKAGAYGIQDEKHDFVKTIKGSLSNVIGFPIEWFMNLVKEKNLF